MKDFRSRWRAALTALAVLAVAGCGGGGGGGSSEQPPAPPVNPSAPTYHFGGRGMGELSIDVLDAGGRLLVYAQFATDLTHRFAAADSPSTVTADCAHSGRITMRLEDRDGDRRASAGDSITAVLEDCGVPVLARSASGTLRVDVLATAPTAATSLRVRMTVVDALRIAALRGGPNIGVITPGTLRGSLGAEWSESATGAQLRAVSTADDDLRFTTTPEGLGLEQTDGYRAIDVSQTLRYDRATTTSSMAFLFDVNGRNGTIRVHMPVPFEGDLNVSPKRFRLDADLAEGRVLRIEPQPQLTGPAIKVALLDANGAVSGSNVHSRWDLIATLMRDRRDDSEIELNVYEGSGASVQVPWRSYLWLPYDQLFDRSGALIPRQRADALFQRPVLTVPGLTEAGAVVRLQFRRAIADSTPDMRFRFADVTEPSDPDFPSWHVAAAVVRRGSWYEIRPAEPLRHGRRYAMQSSFDGVDWNREVVLLDAAGRVVVEARSGFYHLFTDSLIVASVPSQQRATVAPQAPARLRSEVSLLDGQGVARYRWEQLSGPPVRLATPDAAETDVVIEGGGPLPLAEVLVQLTVTDNLGNVDRVRVPLTVGNQVTRGAGFYLEENYGLGLGRTIDTGAGSFFYGPDAGRVAPRLEGQGEGGEIYAFSVLPAGGARLAVGRYPDATPGAPSATRHRLTSGVYCNSVGSSLSGWFEVLDVAYASDGSISRLALDFEQRCDQPLHEHRRGSYRYNSNLPMRP